MFLFFFIQLINCTHKITIKFHQKMFTTKSLTDSWIRFYFRIALISNWIKIYHNFYVFVVTLWFHSSFFLCIFFFFLSLFSSLLVHTVNILSYLFVEPSIQTISIVLIHMYTLHTHVHVLCIWQVCSTNLTLNTSVVTLWLDIIAYTHLNT